MVHFLIPSVLPALAQLRVVQVPPAPPRPAPQVPTSERPSHCTWAWIHSSRSEFSFSRTPSFTWEHSSSAFSRACFKWLWSGWFSGVFSRIYTGERRAAAALSGCFPQWMDLVPSSWKPVFSCMVPTTAMTRSVKTTLRWLH